MPLLVTQGFGTNSSVPAFSNIVPAPNSIQVVFTEDITLSGPALLSSGWSIVNSSGTSLPIISVSCTTNTVTLQTSEHLGGGTYTLTIPTSGIQSRTLNTFPGPFTQTYTGVGGAPTIVCRAGDARTILVWYSEPVIESEALDLDNYSVSGLTISKIEKVNPLHYILTTSKQTASGRYDLIVTGVHDLAGNSI